MTVKSPVRMSTFSTQLDSNFQKLGCALAGGDPTSIAKEVLSDTILREHVLKRVAQEVDTECSSLCRRQPVSVFRKINLNQMENFSWNWFVQEMEIKCPVLYCLIVTVVSKTDSRNTHKKGSVHNPGICMAAAILLKERNRAMVRVQSYISQVMYSSRVQKKVRVYVSEGN